MKMSGVDAFAFPYLPSLSAPRRSCKVNVTNQSGIIITYDHLIGLTLYSFDFRGEKGP